MSFIKTYLSGDEINNLLMNWKIKNNSTASITISLQPPKDGNDWELQKWECSDCPYPDLKQLIIDNDTSLVDNQIIKTVTTPVDYGDRMLLFEIAKRIGMTEDEISACVLPPTMNQKRIAMKM